MDTKTDDQIYEMLNELGLDLDHIGKYSVEATYFDFQISLQKSDFIDIKTIVFKIVSAIIRASKENGRQDLQNELKSLLGISVGEQQ